MTRTATGIVAHLIVFAVACSMVACASEKRATPDETATEALTRTDDPQASQANADARAWLTAARRAHALADEALTGQGPEPETKADESFEEAQAALESLAAEEAPPAIGEAEARAVQKDLYYRLAELALARDDAEMARAWADRGLRLGETEDLFTANLRIVRGRAEEALGDDRTAAADYHRALEINDALLRRVLDGDPP